MAEFQGKVAIVTGAGSGIGEAIARELAAGGASIVVADLEGSAAERVARRDQLRRRSGPGVEDGRR